MNIAFLSRKSPHLFQSDEYDSLYHQLFDILESRGHSIKFVENLPSENFDFGISYNYPHILKKHHLEMFKYGVINTHTGYLPSVKGSAPNMVPLLIGDLPFGVTTHWMTEKLDDGDILKRVALNIPFDPTRTAKDIHLLLNISALVQLTKLINENFLENLDSFPAFSESSNLKPFTMRDFHYFRNLDNVISNAQTDRFISYFQAYNFPPHEGVYITRNNKKYLLTLSVKEVEE